MDLPRGRRPQFTDDPMVDRLYSISLALIAELATTRTRLDTLERVLTRERLLPAAALDSFVESEAEQSQRAQMYQDYLARIFHQSIGAPENAE